jgi:urease accessory protein
VGFARRVTYGLVRACLERRGDATILRSHYARYPLRILAPQPPRQYAGALLYLSMVAGGIQQDDQLEVRLELKAGAEALVTTQAASKVLSMVGGGGARQRHHFTLGDGAVLEYLPDELIPFRGARFVQDTQVDMAATATLMLAELLAPGRVARNERFDYRRLVSSVSVRRDGHLLVRDVADLEPQHLRPVGHALFGSHGYYATLIMVGPRADAALADEMADLLLDQPDVLASASATPHVVLARLLGPTAGVVKAGLRAAWQVARLRLIGQTLPNVPGKLAF